MLAMQKGKKKKIPLSVRDRAGRLHQGNTLAIVLSTVRAFSSPATVPPSLHFPSLGILHPKQGEQMLFHPGGPLFSSFLVRRRKALAPNSCLGFTHVVSPAGLGKEGVAYVSP